MKQLKIFNFFMYGSWSLLNPFLPLYFQNTGFSHIQIGLLMSVGPIVSLIANPFWGYWSDRLQNTKRIILIMLMGNFAASQIFFQFDPFVYVFMFMLLFYFFQTALNPVSNSLILNAIEKTEHHFGTFRLWGSLGFAFMVLVSSPFIQWIGVSNLGYLYGFFILITLLLGLKLPADKGKKPRKNSFPRRDMLRTMTSPLFLFFLIATVLISMPNRMNSTFISVYIGEMGGAEVIVGWSWFIAAIIEVPVFIVLDRYLKTSARTMFGLMVLVSGAYAVRWVLMTVASDPLQVVLIQILHGFTFGITFYVGTQLVDVLVPTRLRTTGQALYALNWMGVAGILGGLVGGSLFDHHGAEAMYIVSSVMSVVGMAGFIGLWLYSRAHHVEADEMGMQA